MTLITLFHRRQLTWLTFDQAEILDHQHDISRPRRIKGTRELVINGTLFILLYQSQLNDVLDILQCAQKWP